MSSPHQPLPQERRWQYFRDAQRQARPQMSTYRSSLEPEQPHDNQSLSRRLAAPQPLNLALIRQSVRHAQEAPRACPILRPDQSDEH